MSTVFFAPPDHVARAIPRLIESSGFPARLDPKQTLGIKLHFGEDGNDGHLEPGCVRAAVDVLAPHVKDCVMLETSTLYRGSRGTADDHIRLALRHGFTSEATGCRILITDGKHGEDYFKAPIYLKHVKEARLGAGLKPVRQILNLAHFKGHMVTGFGGVMKNLAMGLAAKGGKLEMHSQSKPHVVAGKCTACNECVEYCPHQAIQLVHGSKFLVPGTKNQEPGTNDVAFIIEGKCAGCASCMPVCPQGAITFKWNEVSENVSMKVVEYAAAVIKGRTLLHMNVAIRITPNCDCMGVKEKPLMPDAGVFASFDPVACEQAAYDRCGKVLSQAWPELEPEKALAYAEELGLGRRHYEIEEVR
jgi:uncharacterized Fe-S center protein